MSDGEKPFEATPSRLAKARRDGDVARSAELSNAASFGAALFATAAIVPFLARAAQSAIHAASAGNAPAGALAQIGALMLVPAACAAGCAAAAAIAQSGGLQTVSIALKFERLAPGANLKRIFSRDAVVAAVRGIAAFGCAAGALIPAFAAIHGAALGARGLSGVAQAAWSGALRAALVAFGIGAIFAGIDFGLQFARWKKRLRMSFDELKRDQKEHDGDPAMRGRRRSMHRRIARGSIRRVRDAAFVVVNPTHVAIALEYRPPEVPVPRVLVRAADDAALRTRELAAELQIPVIEDPPLARELYRTAREGEWIPAQAYVAIAEIVIALHRAQEKPA